MHKGLGGGAQTAPTASVFSKKGTMLAFVLPCCKKVGRNSIGRREIFSEDRLDYNLHDAFSKS